MVNRKKNIKEKRRRVWRKTVQFILITQAFPFNQQSRDVGVWWKKKQHTFMKFCKFCELDIEWTAVLRFNRHLRETSWVLSSLVFLHNAVSINKIMCGKTYTNAFTLTNQNEHKTKSEADAWTTWQARENATKQVWITVESHHNSHPG